MLKKVVLILEAKIVCVEKAVGYRLSDDRYPKVPRPIVVLVSVLARTGCVVRGVEFRDRNPSRNATVPD